MRENSNDNPPESIIMSMHDDLQAEQPQKRGMSSTAKVLLVLGSIAGVCLLVCCGGVAIFGLRFKDEIKKFAESTSSDPAVVKQRTQEVVEIEIPEEFKPVATWGIPLGAFSMKQFIYQPPGNPNSVLVIMETNQPLAPGQDAKQQREAMQQGMRQGQQMGSIDMQEESRETRQFTINGEEVPFEFIKGKAHGVPAHKVVGIFPGKQGTVMLILMVADSDYDDEKIVNMIKSIRIPGGATGGAMGTATDEPDESTAEKMSDDAEDKEDETDSSSEPATP